MTSALDMPDYDPAARREDLGEVPGGGQMLSVVVPVYGNADSLPTLYAELVAVWSERFRDLGLEIILVDDGSSDSSWDCMCALARGDQRVRCFRLSRNFGQLSAMLAGYEQASGDAVVSISADLQDPTEVVGDMVGQWLAGHDVVIAHRVSREDGSLAAATSRLAYWYARKSTPDLPAGGFDFFLMSRRAMDLMMTYQGRFRFLQGDLLWLGLPFSLLPYTRRRRPYGQSGYTFRKRLKNFAEVVMDSSYGPVRAMSLVGWIVAGLGFIYLLTVIAQWAVGESPFSGWAPIMVVLLVVSGFIMVMLGVIGSYLGRIYDHMRGRPPFVIVEQVNPRQIPPAESGEADGVARRAGG